MPSDSIRESVDDVATSVDEISKDVDTLVTETVKTEKEVVKTFYTFDKVLKVIGVSVACLTIVSIAKRFIK